MSANKLVLQAIKFSYANNARVMSAYNQKWIANHYPLKGYKSACGKKPSKRVKSFCAIHERLPRSEASLFPVFASTVTQTFTCERV